MPSKRIFVTGAAGLIGSALLEAARFDGVESVRGLSRGTRQASDGVEWVRGDLEDLAPWKSQLEGCDAVIHLGASTGRASAAEHMRVNAQGTQALIRAARDVGVPRFVFVSTIAAAYPEVDRYPYAASKRSAEEAVRASALGWTILRPTIVLGTSGGVGPGLVSFARRGRTPLFGEGSVRIQPIGARDTGRLILEALREDSTIGETIDLGGPDALTFREFLRRLRAAAGRKPEGFLRLPLGLAMNVAWAFERAIGPRLPVLAGQLYAFRYDSTVRRSAFLDARMPKIVRVDALIEELTRGAGRG